jgi:hypothetical protein
MQSSIGEALAPVNEWQRQQFAELGVKRRDPMSVSMAIVLDIERRAVELMECHAHGSANTSTSTSTSTDHRSTSNGNNGGNAGGSGGDNRSVADGITRPPPPTDAELETRVCELIETESARFSRNVYGARFRQKFTLADAILVH